MTAPPKFTVIMPLFNKACSVLRAVHSVLRQTCQDLELIVINDESSDTGPSLVRAVRDVRVKLISQPHAGVATARNTGIMAAKGEIVAFLDADDEWRPEFVETINLLEEHFPNCQVFGTAYSKRTMAGTPVRRVARPPISGSAIGKLTHYFEVFVSNGAPFNSSSVAVRASAIRCIGGFPEGVRSGEDLLTWARLATRYEIAYSVEKLAVYEIPADVSRLPRTPECPDRVGAALDDLRRDVRSEELGGFEKFVEQWHRQRLLAFLRRGDYQNAKAETAYLNSGRDPLIRAIAHIPAPCRRITTSVLNTAYGLRYAVLAHP